MPGDYARGLNANCHAFPILLNSMPVLRPEKPKK